MEKSTNAFIVTELPFLPEVGYLTKIANKPLVLLEKCEHFVKSSTRNRTWIANANGKQLLSIPIAGGRSHKQRIDETRIDYSLPWRDQHLKSIQSAYGKAAYFEYYYDELQAIYLDKPELLWAWNERLYRWLLKTVQLNVHIDYTKAYVPNYEPAIDQRTIKNAASVLENPPYYQCFQERHGFISGLSALDLLFNLGAKGAHQYLLKNKSL